MQKRIFKPSRNTIKGSTIEVGDMPFDVAFRKFKKKVEDSNLLRELRDKEFYEKPTTLRKRAKSAARKRWQSEVAKTKLPPKLF